MEERINNKSQLADQSKQASSEISKIINELNETVNSL